MDFGFRDYNTFYKIAIDQDNKKLYIKEIFYENEILIDKIITNIENSCFIRGKDVIVADCSNPQNIQSIRNANYNCIPCKKGPGSILIGINVMLQYEIILDKNCIHIHKEFLNYVWIDSKYKSTPIDFWNHGIDAIRYILTYLLRLKL